MINITVLAILCSRVQSTPAPVLKINLISLRQQFVHNVPQVRSLTIKIKNVNNVKINKFITGRPEDVSAIGKEECFGTSRHVNNVYIRNILIL